MVKYPRTHHVEGSRLQPGDEDLDSVPLAELAGCPLVVEEKLDGANAAFSFDEGGRIHLQSRGHYLTGGARERHFGLFKTWAACHQRTLFDVIGPHRVVYGEWLYAKHTVFYDRLPHYFMEFDVLDTAEGDVWIHTRMVTESLVAAPAWRDLPEGDRAALFLAALLHDVAKPFTSTTEPDGRVVTRGHTVTGTKMARRILWEDGVPFELRERACALIRHHQLLFHLLDRRDSRRAAIRAAQTARLDHLALLMEADVQGRICDDRDELIEGLGMAVEYLDELGCLGAPWPFASDHSRVLYLRKPDRDPHYAAHDDTRCQVTVMSGLPAAGKSHWVARLAADQPVVSLDALREELGVGPTDNQGRVVQESRERVRQHLRRSQDFVHDATNLSLRLRWPLVQLLLDYGARVRIVYVETDPSTLSRRNAARERQVPGSAIERMLRRWEVPDLTEAHDVVTVVG